MLGLETALAQGQWARVDTRDPVKTYNRVELADLAPLAPGFDWPAWLAATGLAGKTGDVVVQQPSYLATVAAQLAATPLPVWKAYLRTHLLGSYALVPRQGLRRRALRLRRHDAVGARPRTRPRWKRGVGFVDGVGGRGARQALRRRATSRRRRRRAWKSWSPTCSPPTASSIDALDWMSPETKQEAQAKLATFAPKIGYPKRWRDYSALETSKATTSRQRPARAASSSTSATLAKLGKPVDRDEWFMTPQTVNAYYNPALNEIVFPAAILQPPFFDPTADDAVNYGAIGADHRPRDQPRLRRPGQPVRRRPATCATGGPTSDRKRFDAKTRLLVAQYRRSRRSPATTSTAS